MLAGRRFSFVCIESARIMKASGVASYLVVLSSKSFGGNYCAWNTLVSIAVEALLRFEMISSHL